MKDALGSPWRLDYDPPGRPLRARGPRRRSTSSARTRTSITTTTFAPSSPRIGDVRASFEMRVLGPTSSESPGFGVWAASARLPPAPGRCNNYAPATTCALRRAPTILGWRGEWLLAAARAGYMYRPDVPRRLARRARDPGERGRRGLPGVTVGPELTVASAIDSSSRSADAVGSSSARTRPRRRARAGGGVGTHALVKRRAWAGGSARRPLPRMDRAGRARRTRSRPTVSRPPRHCAPDVPGDVDGDADVRTRRWCRTRRTPGAPERAEEPSTPTIVPPRWSGRPLRSSRPAGTT